MSEMVPSNIMTTASDALIQATTMYNFMGFILVNNELNIMTVLPEYRVKVNTNSTEYQDAALKTFRKQLPCCLSEFPDDLLHGFTAHPLAVQTVDDLCIVLLYQRIPFAWLLQIIL